MSWIREIARLEQRTLPELFVAYNPWPDHFAHFEGPFADEIISFCREHLAGFKTPKHVEFGELPKTSTGKIQKFLLREKARTDVP